MATDAELKYKFIWTEGHRICRPTKKKAKCDRSLTAVKTQMAFSNDLPPTVFVENRNIWTTFSSSSAVVFGLFQPVVWSDDTFCVISYNFFSESVADLFTWTVVEEYLQQPSIIVRPSRHRLHWRPKIDRKSIVLKGDRPYTFTCTGYRPKKQFTGGKHRVAEFLSIKLINVVTGQYSAIAKYFHAVGRPWKIKL